MQMPQAEFDDLIEKGKLKSIKTGKVQNQSISQKIGTKKTWKGPETKSTNTRNR